MKKVNEILIAYIDNQSGSIKRKVLVTTGKISPQWTLSQLDDIGVSQVGGTIIAVTVLRKNASVPDCYGKNYAGPQDYAERDCYHCDEVMNCKCGRKGE